MANKLGIVKTSERTMGRDFVTLSISDVAVTFFISDIQLESGRMWTATWAVTNLALGLSTLSRQGLYLPWFDYLNRQHWKWVVLFIVAYSAFFVGTVRIVPTTSVHDYEVLATGHGMLTRLEPSLTTSRKTDYYFAHPPLLHFYVAGSFLYYDEWRKLSFFDNQLNGNVPIQQMVVQYVKEPFWLETRTPNNFLAALIVCLLAIFVSNLTGQAWLGILTALAYATCPEVFVRSSYGGYFAITNFALLQILIAIEGWEIDRSQVTSTALILTEIFAALINHKLILLPATLFLWEFLKRSEGRVVYAITKSAVHPVILGFALGTLIFWLYGIAISPHDFWMDHVRHHLLDRAIRLNARGLDMSEYPGVAQLWTEFWHHTGYILLPLAAIALGYMSLSKAQGSSADVNKPSQWGWQTTVGLWLILTILIMFVFSWTDWRQTKHLAPLTLLWYLVIARFSGFGKIARHVVIASMSGMLIWNTWMLARLAHDFNTMIKIPEW